MKIAIRISQLFTILFFLRPADAQDFMLQGWYWDYPQVVSGQRFMAHLESKAEELHESGFTYVWLPPLSKGSGGTFSVGYDVKDYYDIGDYGNARWGRREDYDNILNTFDNLGILAVADMVYNHRDGGSPEDNGAVEGWIENMNFSKVASGDQPFPSDRFRCYLPLGGSSGNEAGTYFFKFHSASRHPNFFYKPYTVMMWTNTVFADYGTAALTESEPNGGGDCGESFDEIELGRRMDASVDDDSGCGLGTDEFALTLEPGDYDPAGDTLWIQMYNTGGGGLADYSDHYIYGLWNADLGMDVQDQIGYQTYTDFTNLPSGMGAMNYLNFKPNGNPTQLNGDLDAMFFFYDLDHTVASTRDELFNFTKWMWDVEGVRGFRVDAVKHFSTEFMGDLLDFLHDEGINPPLVVGELFDFSSSALKGWIDGVSFHMDGDTRDNIDVRIFDFSLRNSLKEACDAFGYDSRNVFESSIVDATGASGFQVVTFVNNHDFRAPGEEVINDPELAYAYILTNNKIGLPTVFYPDFFDAGDLKFKIKGLMEAHKRYITGATSVEYLNRFGSFYSGNYLSGFDNTSLIYQISGGPSGRSVVVAINFAGESLKVDHTVNTGFLPIGETLTDIFAISPNPLAVVNESSQIYMEVPPRSFGVWVQGDLQDEIIPLEDTTTVGIGDPLLNEGSLELFPNPFQSSFTLRVDSEGYDELLVEIFSLEGRLVYQQQFGLQAGENNLKIRAGINHSGAYVLRTSGAGGIRRSLIVKD